LRGIIKERPSYAVSDIYGRRCKHKNFFLDVVTVNPIADLFSQQAICFLKHFVISLVILCENSMMMIFVLRLREVCLRRETAFSFCGGIPQFPSGVGKPGYLRAGLASSAT